VENNFGQLSRAFTSIVGCYDPDQTGVSCHPKMFIIAFYSVVH
jgi:hypothetical protein